MAKVFCHNESTMLLMTVHQARPNGLCNVLLAGDAPNCPTC